MKIENMPVSSHAMTRFKERYEAFENAKLAPKEAEEKLSELLKKSEIEEAGMALEKRRNNHGKADLYTICHPWRFVFSNGILITCEIMPQNISVVKNPCIPPQKRKARHLIQFEENGKKNVTRMYRPFDKSEMILENSPEINAIIRSLRAIGLEVNYKRTGGGNRKAASLEIVIPKYLEPYQIEEVNGCKKIRIFINRNDIFPLGLRTISCIGICKQELERILKFIHIITLNKG